jgi:hypothetical protein
LTINTDPSFTFYFGEPHWWSFDWPTFWGALGDFALFWGALLLLFAPFLWVVIFSKRKK